MTSLGSRQEAGGLERGVLLLDRSDPADAAVGNWYILAKADGEEVVAETSEINNTYARFVQIGPDLHILSFSVECL